MARRDTGEHPVMRPPDGDVRSQVAGVRWPGLPGPEGATLLALQFQLERSQWLPPEVVRTLQFRQLLEVARHAMATVPYYQGQPALAALTDNETGLRAGWTGIPVLSREAVQEAGDRLLSIRVPGAHGRLHRIQTSGSTGRPISVYGTAVTQLFWRAFTLREHLWHRRRLGGRMAVIRPEIQTTDVNGIQHSGWGPAIDAAFHSGPSSLLSSRVNVTTQVRWLQARDPDYLLSLPSNLRALAEELQRRKLALANLCEVRSYGETLDEETRGICNSVFGVPVTDLYSAQEVGYIASQCPAGRYHVQAENLYLELLRDDGSACGPGQVGRVVATPLHNLATPLIRYALGDYAVAGEPCPCGRGLPVIERILGRQRNMLARPDGSRHWPSFPAHCWNHIAPIRQLQLVQHTLSGIEARLVLDRPLDTEQEQAFTAMLQERFGYPCEVRFSYPARIERTRGGKYEDFVSRVSA